MRNLKKILAMVLALVMSLSLMATAGAADFADASSINDTYKVAVDVLEGLGVFRGYDENGTYSFKPDGEITRAETAAIIYRIVTGDVEDKQVSIYADYNIFTDVPSTSWYAGYVNFCANAEYIKGVGNNKFDPTSKVTGYAALAMILRAIGYTANGGFTGSDWAIQTARTAEARKITKNIMTGTLGNYATRQTVAEILFQAILVNMVGHNVLNTLDGSQGYYELDESLGYKTFKLEELEGVVVANEFADLYSDQVLAEGKTNFQVAEDDIRTLVKGTELTDIGESRYAYITGSEVLAFGDTGNNVVWENDGAAVKASKAIAEVGAAKAGETEYYVNFGRDGYYTSDWRIEYTMWLRMTADEIAAYIADNGGRYIEVDVDDYGYTWYNYDRVIYAGDAILQNDMSNIRSIFTSSNGVWNYDEDRTTPYNILGQVFVATQTKEDISDKMSYKQFVETYINDEAWEISWTECDNGFWVKVVDYNNDGVVDYAFLTGSTMDKALGTYKNSAGDEVLGYYSLIDDPDLTDYTVRYLDQVNVGDVILYTIIDNQALVELAKVDEAKINTVNYKDVTVTAVDGTVYEQSYIINATRMQQWIINMAANENYNLYLDHFGYVRAYDQSTAAKYALLTEIYATNNQDGHLVKSHPLTVEMVTGNEDGTTTTRDEYSTTSTVFVADEYYSLVSNQADTSLYYNWLLPATAHIGVDWNNLAADPNFATSSSSNWTFWSKNNQVIRKLDAGSVMNYTFDYVDRSSGVGPYTRTVADANGNPVVLNYAPSFTNVARYADNGDGSVTLYGAARYAYETNGSIATRTNGQPVFAVDYVQLATTDPGKGAAHYNINTNYTGYATTNGYVDAVNDTEYFIVYNGGVFYCKGRTNFPGLSEAGEVYAAYAVATNYTEDYVNNNDYWIADVIVYEVENNPIGTNYDSISLVYYNTLKSTTFNSGILDLLTLNNEHTPINIDVLPGGLGWNAGQYQDVGFYTLWDVDAEDDALYAGNIEKILDNFNENGIYAGVINRSVGIIERGEYIDVYKQVTYDVDGEIATYADKTNININNPFGIKEYNAGTQYYTNYVTEAIELRGYSNMANGLGEYWGSVKGGDRIIWVENGDGKVAYIVDLDAILSTQSTDRWTPTWLVTLWNRIMNEQIPERNYLLYTGYTQAQLEELSPATLTNYMKWLKDYADVTTTMITRVQAAAATVAADGKTTVKEAADLNAASAALTTTAGDRATLNAYKVTQIGTVKTDADTAIAAAAGDPHEAEIVARINAILAAAKADINAIVLEDYATLTDAKDAVDAIVSQASSDIAAAGTYSADITVEVTNKNGAANATVDAAEIDFEQASTDGGLTITVVDNNDAKDLVKVNVTLPAEEIAENLGQTDTVTVETAIGTVAFPVKTLDKILRDNPTVDSDITIVVEDAGEVGDDILGTLEEGAAAIAYDVTIESNGEELNVNGVSITLTLPVSSDVATTGDTVYVYYVDANGDLVPVTTATVDADGNVVFATTHLTQFVVSDSLLDSGDSNEPDEPVVPAEPEVSVAVKPARLYDYAGSVSDAYTSYSVVSTVKAGVENTWDVTLNATGVKQHQNVSGSNGYWVGVAFVPSVTPAGWSVESASLRAYSNMDDSSNGDSRGGNDTFTAAQYEDTANKTGVTADLIAYYINVGSNPDTPCTWKFKIEVEWTLTNGTTTKTVTDTYYLDLNVTTANAG